MNTRIISSSSNDARPLHWQQQTKATPPPAAPTLSWSQFCRCRRRSSYKRIGERTLLRTMPTHNTAVLNPRARDIFIDITFISANKKGNTQINKSQEFMRRCFFYLLRPSFPLITLSVHYAFLSRKEKEKQRCVYTHNHKYMNVFFFVLPILFCI